MRRLRGLAERANCAGVGQGLGRISVVGGVIGPAEIAAVPGLIAFGNPAYQVANQSRFARLGDVPPAGLESSSFLGIGASSGGTASWALELLAIMLLVGLVGLIRAARVGSRVRPRSSGRKQAGVVTALPRDAAGRGQLGQERGTAARERERDELAA